MTAREFVDPSYQLLTYGRLLSSQEELVIFAQLHVRKALQAALDNIRLTEDVSDYAEVKYPKFSPEKQKRAIVIEDYYLITFDDNEVLNAYPPENIK